MSNFNTNGWDDKIATAYGQSLRKILSYEDVIDRLNRDLQKFPGKLEEGLRQNEFLDRDLAESLLEMCRQLLAQCANSMPKDQVPFVLAAVDYFLNKDDGEPDFKSLDGFQDDEAVLKAVITQFGINLDQVPAKDKKGA